MEALGVGDDSRVVLYDAGGSVWAARVWWMLRWIGFDRAALLDGGLNAWTAGERPLSTEPASRPAGTLTVNLRPELIADRDGIGHPDRFAAPCLLPRRDLDVRAARSHTRRGKHPGIFGPRRDRPLPAA
jgi:thiosulfate/3-mercaptopyruvate sulfurtransferase